MWKKLCGALLPLTMLLALLPCRAEAVQLSAAAAILFPRREEAAPEARAEAKEAKAV